MTKSISPTEPASLPSADRTGLQIGASRVGQGAPVFVVAELSGNHNQRFETAEALVRAAHAAGANAVKLQTYTPDTLTIACDRPEFRIGQGTLWAGKNLHKLYAEATTPWDWHAPLAQLCASLGMECFSTPFDRTAVDFLEQHRAPAHKIASFELIDLELVEYAARTMKPIIMSTGMASLQEIDEAVAVVRSTGNQQLCLLVCSSAYPSPPEAIRLGRMARLAERYQVPVGLSDHTHGTAVPVAAVALGAVMIEKHFCLSRQDPGPDSAFSLEPAEFADMVRAVRVAELAIRGDDFSPSSAEQPSLAFRRSVFAVRDVPAGTVLTRDDVRVIRPGHGLHPRHFKEVLGRTSKVALERGQPISWDQLL